MESNGFYCVLLIHMAVKRTTDLRKKAVTQKQSEYTIHPHLNKCLVEPVLSKNSWDQWWL